MKIAFLTQNLNTYDGGGRFSHDLVENLKKEGIEVVKITTEKVWILLNFFKIRKIFKNSDTIHAVDIWPNGFYARLISLGLKKPIVITSLGTYSVAPFYSWRRFMMKWTCNYARIVAISDYTKEKILEVIPKLKINIITPGFDLDFWSGGKTSESEAIKFKPYILSVGALKSRKGYVNSIKAFSIIAKKNNNFNYVIVGQGVESSYGKKLKSEIRENKLENRVFFISNGVDDNQLLGFYKNAELFILTPIEECHHFEGFGIVYLEAAASGLPIVAVNNSGAISATKDGYNSILVSQNDPEAAADAIIKILSDEAIKTKLENNGREWIKEFSWNKIIKKYIEIYEDTIDPVKIKYEKS